MTREILLVPHANRQQNLEATSRAAELLQSAGITVRVCADEKVLPGLKHVPHTEDAAAGCELVLVLGGDGTFLRAADMARAVDIPVLGINLGHVGFLAEWEVESLDQALVRVIEKRYRIEDRLTIDVSIFDEEGTLLNRSWALNEASVENQNRSGVLDAILEVDRRPVSSFGCDGVLMNTAIAHAREPVRMATAMRHAVLAGREAFLAGRMPARAMAQASSPQTGYFFR